MRRNVAVLAGIVGFVALVTALLSAWRRPSPVATGSEPAGSHESPPATEDERLRRERALEERLDREFPTHGLVTKTQLTIRVRPDGEATSLGWLRIGAHLRMKAEPTRTASCRSGWYELHPRGYACAGQGIEPREAAPDVGTELGPDLGRALPYAYYFVKEPQVPEWHQLPSREDQREAQLHAERYLAFLTAGDEARARRLRGGELTGEPEPPHEVARWLDHGFFIASNGTEVRSRRRFVRTVRGSYVKESQLEAREGAQFHGLELTADRTLPVAWMVRASRPMVRRERSDGTIRMVDEEGVEPLARLAMVPWRRRERIGDQQYHVIETPQGEERWVRDWFIAVAEAREPPAGIAAEEPWVHVDISSQTLVLYVGPRPIYATLVSSGVSGHDTPEGEFVIRRKMVTDTMADLGDDAGDDRYRIEDVPWTQYFEGSIALHAAFWHAQYGIPRSHGCVNLAPRDAQFVFLHTWPDVPRGWHGISTEGTGVQGSRVIVTH